MKNAIGDLSFTRRRKRQGLVKDRSQQWLDGLLMITDKECEE
ncbi:MAG TPA: hypothetical protein VK104_04060 [Burkholderiaceae bacterium]|nr:hypothetical protein [Burkholderiaceae bacterium]